MEMCKCSWCGVYFPIRDMYLFYGGCLCVTCRQQMKDFLKEGENR